MASAATMAPPMVDVAAIATRLGVSVRGVRRMVATNEIPHYRVGGQLRFDVGEVLNALRGGQEASA